jgi:hypothetical protein
MQLPRDLNEYLRARASELADRILRTYPPLHGVDDPASPLIRHLLRKPFPAQVLAMMGVVKRWNEARGGGSDCGMWDWKDTDFAWSGSRAQRPTVLHGPCHGPTTTG